MPFDFEFNLEAEVLLRTVSFSRWHLLLFQPESCKRSVLGWLFLKPFLHHNCYCLLDTWHKVFVVHYVWQVHQSQGSGYYSKLSSFSQHPKTHTLIEDSKLLLDVSVWLCVCVCLVCSCQDKSSQNTFDIIYSLFPNRTLRKFPILKYSRIGWSFPYTYLSDAALLKLRWSAHADRTHTQSSVIGLLFCCLKERKKSPLKLSLIFGFEAEWKGEKMLYVETIVGLFVLHMPQIEPRFW